MILDPGMKFVHYTSEGSIEERFHRDLDAAVGARVRASDMDADLLWGSLANVKWMCPDGVVTDTFRGWAAVVAEICGANNPMANYCAAPSGVVAPWISEAMAEKGWRWEPA